MPHTGAARADGRLRLHLLGWWRLSRLGRPIELNGREQRLTALLALRETRPRLDIAATLWPDTTEGKALASLRAAVMRTQRKVPGLLDSRRSTIALSSAVEVDIRELRRVMAERGIVHANVVTGVPVSLLECEELLPGWYDEWVVFERERHRQRLLRTLEAVARAALDRGDLGAATDAAAAATQIEPLLESVRVVTIKARLQLGDAGGAVREFQDYRRQVVGELGVEPSRALADLLTPLLAVNDARTTTNGAVTTSTLVVPAQRDAGRNTSDV